MTHEAAQNQRKCTISETSGAAVGTSKLLTEKLFVRMRRLQTWNTCCSPRLTTCPGGRSVRSSSLPSNPCGGQSDQDRLSKSTRGKETSITSVGPTSSIARYTSLNSAKATLVPGANSEKATFSWFHIPNHGSASERCASPMTLRLSEGLAPFPCV